MRMILIAITATAFLAAAFAHGADFSPSEVCKAAIAVEMGRKAKSMKTLQQNPPEISYRREDGDNFTYRCKLDGGIVVWRTYFSDSGEWGRWRDQYAEGDALTAWTVSGGTLTINNDMSGVQTFTKKDF